MPRGAGEDRDPDVVLLVDWLDPAGYFAQTVKTSIGNAPSCKVINVSLDRYVHNGWSQVLKIDLREGARGKNMWIHDPKVENPGAMRGSVALLGTPQTPSLDAVIALMDRRLVLERLRLLGS